MMMAILFTLGLCPVAEAHEHKHEAAGRVAIPNQATAQQLDSILSTHHIQTAGIGILRNGKLVWAHYAGKETPGVPASAKTRFNVASLTKPVVAETMLRLVDTAQLDLDEPLSSYWIDPDVANDPRRDALTARQVLDHTSGFPNWRFLRADRKLTFEHVPGTHHGYSGEGFEYLSHAVANKLEQPFPDIIQRMVFDPIGMHDTAIEVDTDRLQHVVRPVDDAGKAYAPYCRPGGWCRPDGSYSAADDLLTTVPDYARFLAAVHRGAGYSDAIARERDRVHTDRGEEQLIDCTNREQAIPCPRAQGYGLGFEVADFGTYTVRGHTGSDWSEQTVAYLYQPSGDGVIIFLNGPQARARQAMPELLAIIDPSSPFLPRYQPPA